MRYTLLELTQRILESMDSDEVSSIDDTVESLAVAHIVKECYFNLVGKLDFPEQEDIFQLTGSGDSTKPCVMYLPQDVLDLNRVKYNSSTVGDPVWYDLQYQTLDQYLDQMSSLDIDDDNVGAMTLVENGQTFTFKYRNDQLPNFYTSFNDRTILFDSYSATANTTLVGTKTMCYGAVEPTFTMEDTHTPDLDPRQFDLLLNAAKAQAFVELKQIQNPKAEIKERKGEINAQRTKHAIDRRTGSQTYRGYGRK
jgi:hypothetical protein